jgi:hypothetical protein
MRTWASGNLQAQLKAKLKSDITLFTGMCIFEVLSPLILRMEKKANFS